MSNSILHKFSLIPEVTYGVTPATPTFVLTPVTGVNLALSKGTLESGIINLNRQVTDVRHGNRQVGGEISTELIYGEFDLLLQALLGGTWTPRIAAYTAGTISAASADNSLNDSANAFPVFLVGENVSVSGFTGAGIVTNLGNAVIVSRTVSKLVLSGITLTTDAAGEVVTITSLNQTLVPGVTQRSFSALRQYTDVAATGSNYPFQLYKGLEVNKLSLTLSPESFVKAGFSMFGREMVLSNADPATAYTAASTRKPFDAFSGVVTVDGSAVANITEIQLTVENGIQPRFVLFDDKTLAPKIGRCRVTGTITLYFQDSTFLSAFNGATKRALSFTLTDPVGNTYTFDLPSILGTGAQTDVQGESDIMVPFPFSAIFETGAAIPDALKITRDPL